MHGKNAKNLTAVGCAASAGQLEAVVELVRQGAAWRNLTDINVVKAIVRKTTYRQASKHSVCCLSWSTVAMKLIFILYLLNQVCSSNLLVLA